MNVFLNNDKLKPVFKLKAVEKWTEGWWGLRNQFSNISPTGTNHSFVVQQNLEQATDWLHKQVEAQTDQSDSAHHFFPAADSVSVTVTQWCHPKRQQKCLCPSQSSLTNTCIPFSKGGVPGGALWQSDVLQVGHADHHAPAGLALGTHSPGGHFLYGQPSGGGKHQI